MLVTWIKYCCFWSVTVKNIGINHDCITPTRGCIQDATKYNAFQIHLLLWKLLMRLTTFSDYALRVLMFLAVRDDRKSTIGEISERYGISKNHLMKVVSLLTRQGFVLSTRGPGGGLFLARRAEEIVIGDVIRKTEDDLALVECFRSGNACTISNHCKLGPVLGQALKAFVAVLDGVTLADIVSNRGQLRTSLNLVE